MRWALLVSWMILGCYGMWVTGSEWRQSAKDRRALLLRVESDDVDLLMWTGLHVRLSAGRLLVQVIFAAAGVLATFRWHTPVIPWLLVTAQGVAVWLATESRRVRRVQSIRKRRKRGWRA